jgi:hypothetical protein
MQRWTSHAPSMRRNNSTYKWFFESFQAVEDLGMHLTHVGPHALWFGRYRTFLHRHALVEGHRGSGDRLLDEAVKQLASAF